MRTQSIKAVLSLFGFSLAGCASNADKIGASYISPLQYQNYTCVQLGDEAQRVSGRVAQLSGVQDQKAN